MSSFFQGFGLGAGLIIAIGAQNAFVLSQGVRRQYHWLIPAICAICDAVLIAAGVAGVGTLITAHPPIAVYAGIGGSVFLFLYGFRSLFAALRRGVLEGTEEGVKSLQAAVLTTLALTLLNPHVYLDTVVLLGSLSGRFEGIDRYIFAAGACSASFIWFFSLSLGGSLLAPLFRHPLTWKILDLIIWLTMWILAYSIWPRV